MFRVLAGLLALLFVVVLTFGQMPGLSLLEKLGYWVVTVSFSLYAIFGSDFGERFLYFALGGRYPEKD